MSYSGRSGPPLRRGIAEHYKPGGIITYHSESRSKDRERFDREDEWDRGRDSVAVGYPYTQGLLPIPHLYSTAAYAPPVIPMGIISPPMLGMSARKRDRDSREYNTRETRDFRPDFRDSRDMREVREMRETKGFRDGKEHSHKRFPRRDNPEKEVDSGKLHRPAAIPSHLSSSNIASWTTTLSKGDSLICNLTCFPDPSYEHPTAFNPTSLVMNKKTDIDHLILNIPAEYSVHYLHPTTDKDLVGYLQFLVYLLERRRVGTVYTKDDKGNPFVVHLLPPCPETFSMIGKCKERTLYAMVVQRGSDSKKNEENDEEKYNEENENEERQQYHDPPPPTEDITQQPSPIMSSPPRHRLCSD
eukprot:TRINITY_DN7048_c0_g1_i1.p1 TRINITY_DN7048_c0_g1~~TRINITY_DN7048_c0_g1_i1.p1  ORF type:complete len:358 (-),score=84.70 TRINITY_DN7048_c0_g1_i1:67-1140(-)